MPLDQNGEPGWLAGEIRGHTGWFPESYVERLEMSDAVIGPMSTYIEEVKQKPLEYVKRFCLTKRSTYTFFSSEVADAPEISEIPDTQTEKRESLTPEAEPEYYIANYPYQSIEQGDLSFNSGDVITVLKKEGDWWTGKLKDVVGIFPSNYVQKYEGVCIIYYYFFICR